MWSPISLKIVNLFSHEDSYFEFVNNQTTTIYGINKTDLNVQSNGSGKTSILDCISIALLGDPLRGISKKEIVRNGEKSGEVEFVMENKVLQQVVKIKWEINVSKSNNALIWINDEPDNSLKDLSPKETAKYILSLLKIDEDDLRNYFLISKDSYSSFFLSGDTAKKAIINRFSKADIIDNVEPLIKADIVLLDETITKLVIQKNANDGVLSHLDQELIKEKLESSIEQTRALTIKTLEEKRDEAQKLHDELPGKIKVKEKELTDQEEEVRKKEFTLNVCKEQKKGYDESILVIEDEITKIQTKQDKLEATYKPKFDKLSATVKECEDEIKTYKTNLKECEEEIGQIDSKLAGQIECPKCNFKFILKDKEYSVETALEKKKELEELKVEINQFIQAAEKQITESNTEVEKLKKEITDKSTQFVTDKAKHRKEIADINTTLIQVKKDITEQEAVLETEVSKVNTIKRGLNDLKGQTEGYIKTIKENEILIKAEKTRVYPNKTADLENQVKGLTIQNDLLKEEIEGWEADKAVLYEWQERFKQFKSFLANTSISSIEEMTNFFLDKMKTNLRVNIEGYRELSNKKLKEEINTLVTRDGLNGESFSKFSGGEKAKIDLACILAMQKIINISTQGGGLNLLFIDEILESIDSTSLVGVVRALAQLDQTILLITHVEQNMFDCNKLQVEKVNGISKVLSLS